MRLDNASSFGDCVELFGDLIYAVGVGGVARPDLVAPLSPICATIFSNL
jgi:hypothetical protein